jgi:hypothetical protein
MASKVSNQHRPQSSTPIHVGVMSTNSDAAIWTRLLQPERADLSEDAARSILRIGFNEQDKARMHELALKAQEGTLTESEQGELENYCRVGRSLDLIHSKARRSLKKLSPTT